MIKTLLLMFAFVLFIISAWRPDLGAKFIPLGWAMLTLSMLLGAL